MLQKILFLTFWTIISGNSKIINSIDIFEKVYGFTRILTHYNLNNDNLFNYNEINFNDNSNLVTNSHLVCDKYLNGLTIKNHLIELFGEINIHTSYLSEKENIVCYLVLTKLTSNEIITNSLEKNIQFSHVKSIPHQLKIHQSAMFYLGLTSTSNVHKKLLKQFQMEKKYINDLEDFTLLISTGVGVPSKYSSDATLIAERIHHKIINTDNTPFASLLKYRSISSPDSPSLGVWANAEISSCNYHNLDIQVNNESGAIYITNLHTILPDSTATATTNINHQQNLNSHVRGAHDAASPHITTTSTSSSSSTSHNNNNIDENSFKKCYANLLAILALEDNILDVRVRGKYKLFNYNGKSIVQSNTITSLSYPYHEAGLTGSGQVIGIGDSGVDELSCFFENSDSSLVARSSYRNPTYDLSKRVVVQYINFANSGDVYNGHGTHVCGTIAGSFSSTVNYNGHGVGAKLAFFDMSVNGESIIYPPPLSKNVFPAAYSAGARLHSNSWGSTSNMYDDSCIDIDNYHVTNQDFLALFAAGNDGTNGYYSVGTPAVAKNSLAIGASYNDLLTTGDIEDIAPFSSLGPTFDSRIKPDIVAPGYSVNSAAAGSSCSVHEMSGTSMATPAVAGNAALVRNYFQNSDFWATMCRSSYTSCAAFSPKGATVKATLIHSGHLMDEYIGSSGSTKEPTTQLSATPDSFEGFGRVSLQNVLPYTNIETVLDLFVEELTMTTLQKISYTVTVTDTSRPLKATIVWMDPGNTIVSEKVLLSDIDLQIVSPSSTVYYGNNRPGDEVNNVEQVYIETPTLGDYTVTIRSKVFTETVSQPVSLIITSAGNVHNKVISVTSTTYASNEISCSTGQQMVTINLYDNGGNGWGSGNSFVIQDLSLTTTYYTGTMNGDVGKDSSKEESICLTEGTQYTAKLIQNGSNKKDMGVVIQQCGIYLSSNHLQNVIDLTTSSECNLCTNTQFSLQSTLYGPTHAIPYGWKQDSTYSLFQKIDVNTTNVIAIGTLTTGVISGRKFCLDPGTYYLEFDDVPANDDIYFMGTVGISTYRVEISNCGTATNLDDDYLDDDIFIYPRVQPGYGFEITVSSSSTCSLQVVDDSREPIAGGDDDAAISFTHLKKEDMVIGMLFGFITLLFILH